MRNTSICMAMMAVALLGSCSSDKPDNLEPKLTTLPATDISRNSALLHGKISLPDKSEAPWLTFDYGTSEGSMETSVNVTQQGNELLGYITGLTAGQTYYYRLQGFIPLSKIYGETLSFTTLPNEKPSVATPKILSYGPTSIIVDCILNSDGGDSLHEAGCYYAYNEEEPKQKNVEDLTSLYTNGNVQILISGLMPNTTYKIWGYATNKYGQTLSDTITHTTRNALMLSEAGILKELIGNDKLTQTSLSIGGYLNGDDIEYLRLMANTDADSDNSLGKLTDINMADALIVNGGGSFGPFNHHSKTNVVGQGMFGNCTHLANIILPLAATTIEKDAFIGCTNLRQIEIPASVSQLLPSSGCTALEEIKVSAANTWYSSQDGVLFNADKSQLLWFPLGKKGEYTIPTTVATIGDYAFAECNIQKFVLPDHLTSIGQGVFMNSKIEEAVLPARLKSLPTGTFQGCTSLKIVRLGEKLELISDYVFDNCPLTDVYIDAPTPPVCSSKSFSTHGNDFLSTCRLHVPKDAKSLYRNNSNWSKFLHIVEQ